jgi:hypothetical protein
MNGHLVLVQLTSPSGEASPRRTPCDVPGNVRRVPATWVRRRVPRLHPPPVGTRLVSWTGTMPHPVRRK